MGWRAEALIRDKRVQSSQPLQFIGIIIHPTQLRTHSGPTELDFRVFEAYAMLRSGGAAVATVVLVAVHHVIGVRAGCPAGGCGG